MRLACIAIAAITEGRSIGRENAVQAGINVCGACAGVVFNMILAFGVLVAQVNNVGYNDITYQQGVRLPIIQPGSAAERYGLLPGDMVLELDGVPVKPGAPRCAPHVVTFETRHRWK